MVKRTTLLDTPQVEKTAPAPETKWMLHSFKVEKKLFSNPPVMVGRIEFRNDEHESFEVNLSEDQCRQIISIIADTVKSAANDLAAKINASL